MDYEKKIDIPFGAHDSELKGWEYTIPEGMEAIIKDGKVIVREKESEDERIIEEIKFAVMQMPTERQDTKERCITWLEKQKEQKPTNSENPKELSEEQLLEEAVEGFVATHLTSEGTKITVNSDYLPKEICIKPGEKVRIIIVKEK